MGRGARPLQRCMRRTGGAAAGGRVHSVCATCHKPFSQRDTRVHGTRLQGVLAATCIEVIAKSGFEIRCCGHQVAVAAIQLVGYTAPSLS